MIFEKYLHEANGKLVLKCIQYHSTERVQPNSSSNLKWKNRREHIGNRHADNLAGFYLSYLVPHNKKASFHRYFI